MSGYLGGALHQAETLHFNVGVGTVLCSHLLLFVFLFKSSLDGLCFLP